MKFVSVLVAMLVCAGFNLYFCWASNAFGNQKLNKNEAEEIEVRANDHGNSDQKVCAPPGSTVNINIDGNKKMQIAYGCSDCNPPPTKPKPSNCSAAWVKYGDSCFYIDDTPTEKQTEARTACQNMGADLPIIRSAESNKFMFDLVKKQRTVTHLGVWLGIHRNESDSKLYWIDGTPLEGQYQNWQFGEPNNRGNNEYCAQMFGAPGTWKVEPGKWNDLPCDFRAGNDAPVVLCQKTI